MTDYTDFAYWAQQLKMSLSRYFVLHALAHHPMHGYEITKWCSEVTSGCCSPSEGALYPLLRELEQGGYVSCSAELASGRERKVYTLTDKGRLAHEQAASAWVAGARLILRSVDNSLTERP